MMSTNAIRQSIVQELVHRILNMSQPVQVEPAGPGRSTEVFRVTRGGEVFYVRILPEAGASFAPEVKVHQHLLRLDVRVPEVVYYEDLNEQLQRSIMVTTAITGQPLAEAGIGPETERILYEAGQDLAQINSIPVTGFGWIKRDVGVSANGELRADRATFREFVFDPYDSLNEHLGFLEFYLFSGREVAEIRERVNRLRPELDETSSWLAHGDFDTTHIYQDGGKYSGIIDFGEIRGADRWYDLAHFRVHDEERIPERLLPWLIEGYRSITEIPGNLDERLALLGLINAVRALGRNLKQNAMIGTGYQRHLESNIRRDLALLR
jgi:aminoglycoside phosphotransferase (APT) family kinase protein